MLRVLYVNLIVLSLNLIFVKADVSVNNFPKVNSHTVEEIAKNVCEEIITMEQEIDSCMNNFLNSWEVSSQPSPVQVECRSLSSITYKIQRSNSYRLVVLITADENASLINYKLTPINKQIDRILVDSTSDLDMWSTVVSPNGSHSSWTRGPSLTNWDAYSSVIADRQYDVTVAYGHYDPTRNTIRVNITWERMDDEDGCFRVTHFCHKKISGDFKYKTINPDDAPLLVDDVLLGDKCTVKITGKYSETKYIYETASCEEYDGCMYTDLKDVTAEVEKAAVGDSWDVTVRWTRPPRDPQSYHVTLLVDGEPSVVVPGNATRVLFTDVRASAPFDVTVEAENAVGIAHFTVKAFFPVKVSRGGSTWAVAAGCGVLAAAAMMLAAALYWRRRRTTTLMNHYFQDIEDKLAKESMFEDIGQESGKEDKWEIAPDRLQLHEVIGEGAFGVVRRGNLSPGGNHVAVKMLKEFPSVEEVRSFRSEMELMKSVGAHPHVVSLLGCCSGRRPLIVAEYCGRGDLLTFLRCSWDVMVSKLHAKYYNNTQSSDYRQDLYKSSQKDTRLVMNKLYDLQGVCDVELTSSDLLSFCRQIAKGMEFLASNRVVHRDLAARNILVTADRTLKIADFGLSRDIYQENQYKQKGNGKMPVKWMALESLTHRIYTTQSDVWSFGVVIWEVVTVGGAPYPGVAAARLPRLLRAGYRMPRPNNCSPQLYEVMTSCWRARPRERPTFGELQQRLDALLHSACAATYLSLELDDEPPALPRYLALPTRLKRAWSRYERPLKAPHNHYTSPPERREHVANTT